MYSKTITTFTGEEIIFNVPESAKEISIGKLIAITMPDLSPFETLSVITGVDINHLYEGFDIAFVSETVISYLEAINYVLQYAIKPGFMPKSIKLNLNGKTKRVKVRNNLTIEPVGCHIEASKIIEEEINTCKEKFGEAWMENFNPSLQACSEVLDYFLYYPMMRPKRYRKTDLDAFKGTSKQLNVSDVLTIAKHFFNAYPVLSDRKPGLIDRLRGLTDQFFRKEYSIA